MQRKTWMILLLVLVLAAAACAGDDTADTGDTADDGVAEDDADTGADVAATGEDTASPAAAGGEATGEAIPVGAVFDLSGATADVGTPYGEGVRAYVEWRNANGGIDGRPIELLWQDYAYDVANAEQLYSQFISEGAVAFQGWGTGDTEALRGRVATDEIPFMSASYSEALTDPAETPYNFVVALSYSDQMRVALNHIASTADGHVEVAVFHHDSPFGESPLEDGRNYIEEQGYDIGYQTYAMPGGATDFVGELTQAQSQGANYIIIQNVSSPGAQLARDVASQGLDATIVCLNWCSDELFVELAGEASEGSIGVLPFAPPAQAEGGLEDVESYLQDNGQTIEDIDLHFTQGWFTMHVMAEGIARAAEQGEITGPAIREALETMDPIETPVTTPIDFTPEDHSGQESGRVYEVQEGTWTPITDAITP